MTPRAQAVLEGDDSKKGKLTTEELRWLKRQKKPSKSVEDTSPAPAADPPKKSAKKK